MHRRSRATRAQRSLLTVGANARAFLKHLFFAQFNLSAPHSSRQSDTDTVSDRFFARS